MKQSVIGIVHTREEAEILVDRLEAEAFPMQEISVLFPDKQGTTDFVHDNSTKAPEGAVTGASAGGVVGGALGLLAGIGLLAIPGIGPLIAAGPIMASLSGVAVGATLGGITGALAGMGIPEYEAKMYEGKVRDGNFLVAAHCSDDKQLKAAERLFQDARATDIHRVEDTAVKKK